MIYTINGFSNADAFIFHHPFGKPPNLDGKQ